MSLALFYPLRISHCSFIYFPSLFGRRSSVVPPERHDGPSLLMLFSFNKFPLVMSSLELFHLQPCRRSPFSTHATPPLRASLFSSEGNPSSPLKNGILPSLFNGHAANLFLLSIDGSPRPGCRSVFHSPPRLGDPPVYRMTPNRFDFKRNFPGNLVQFGFGFST